jgi:hypothetical protein
MKTRMAELSDQSLRLDEARRRHYKKVARHNKENVMQSDNVSAVPQSELENPDLVNARALFQKIEMEVHAELALQAQRARGVQEYLTAAMQIQAARLNEAAAVHSNPGMQQSPMMVQQSPMGAQHSPMMMQEQAVVQQPVMQAEKPHLRT